MNARDILLKHLNKGVSERKRKFNNLVDWSLFIEAMEDYAEVKNNDSLGCVSNSSLPNLKKRTDY